MPIITESALVLLFLHVPMLTRGLGNTVTGNTDTGCMVLGFATTNAVIGSAWQIHSRNAAVIFFFILL